MHDDQRAAAGALAPSEAAAVRAAGERAAQREAMAAATNAATQLATVKGKLTATTARCGELERTVGDLKRKLLVVISKTEGDDALIDRLKSELEDARAAAAASAAHAVAQADGAAGTAAGGPFVTGTGVVGKPKGKAMAQARGPVDGTTAMLRAELDRRDAHIAALQADIDALGGGGGDAAMADAKAEIEMLRRQIEGLRARGDGGGRHTTMLTEEVASLKAQLTQMRRMHADEMLIVEDELRALRNAADANAV
jgi:chromosome segregation ATPase